MRFVLIFLLAGGGCGSAWARLGDTRDQAESRYGIEKHEGTKLGQTPLLQGAKEITFESGGWAIRCGLLKATDGKEYVVREEYRKLWNTDINKAGGTMMLRDFERVAVLQAEGGNLWVEWKSGTPGIELYSPQLNQFTHLAGITGNIWMRKDGAIARTDAVGMMITFDLPQALKHEVELTAANQQKVRPGAGRISGAPVGQNQAHPFASPENPPPIKNILKPDVVPQVSPGPQAANVFIPISSFAPSRPSNPNAASIGELHVNLCNYTRMEALPDPDERQALVNNRNLSDLQARLHLARAPKRTLL
jgi:hypothetical protein